MLAPQTGELREEIWMREFAYPVERMPDGIEVRVRTATPDDVEKIGDMFARLSPRTIYERFHIPYQRVPEWAPAQFTGAGHRDGEFLIAVVAEEVVGHAMYVRPDGGLEAEIAVVVEDGWQSRGVGKLLLRELAERARRRGVEGFTGVALAENRRVLALIRSLFSDAGYAVEDGSYNIHMPLRPPGRKPAPWSSRPAA